MITVAFNVSPDIEMTVTIMPQVPVVGDTVRFNDRAWEVTAVTWVPEKGNLIQGQSIWHAEVTVK